MAAVDGGAGRGMLALRGGGAGRGMAAVDGGAGRGMLALRGGGAGGSCTEGTSLVGPRKSSLPKSLPKSSLPPGSGIESSVA
jgi:hypothetical protein